MIQCSPFFRVDQPSHDMITAFRLDHGLFDNDLF